MTLPTKSILFSDVIAATAHRSVYLNEHTAVLCYRANRSGYHDYLHVIMNR